MLNVTPLSTSVAFPVLLSTGETDHFEPTISWYLLQKVDQIGTHVNFGLLTYLLLESWTNRYQF